MSTTTKNVANFLCFKCVEIVRKMVLKCRQLGPKMMLKCQYTFCYEDVILSTDGSCSKPNPLVLG